MKPLETVRFIRGEVAKWFILPPHKVADEVTVAFDRAVTAHAKALHEFMTTSGEREKDGCSEQLK